jgi:hypothetical protein
MKPYATLPTCCCASCLRRKGITRRGLSSRTLALLLIGAVCAALIIWGNYGSR